MFYPDKIYKRIYNVPLRELFSLGIRGLILDIDNTLTLHNSPDIDALTKAWLKEAEEIGFKLMILSNNKKERVAPFAKSLNIDFVANGGKPLLFGAKKCKEKLGIGNSQLAFIGDQIFTDVLCAKRFGSLSILLEPIQKEKFLFFRLKRYIEKLILKNYKEKKGERR